MKLTLTLLLALAATAHAQFAVMHTNGVVTSPTNLSIQQSNVAGLSNALAGKLATNGTASGLTGFVGTTNAETARGNLGISNTFAGQFHADFFEDYSRYTNGTVVGAGFVPTIGGAYSLILGGTNYNAPQVTDGSLRATNGETYYLTTELPRNVYNFGATIEFDQASAGNAIAFIIGTAGSDSIFGKMLHIVVSPWTVFVDVTTNAVPGFQSIISDNFAQSSPLQPGVSYDLVGQIDGDTLLLNWAGNTYKGHHALMTSVVGKFFTHEGFYTTNTFTNRIHKVWANSPSAPFTKNQPASTNLSLFDRGRGRLDHNLIVATNAASGQRIADLDTNSVYIEGGTRVKGSLTVSVASQFATVGGVHQYGGGVGNTNTTNLSKLLQFAIIANALSNDWSRWKGTYVGSFAENTNAKRITFNMAGNKLDTGSLNETGEWKMEALVYRSTNNSHEGFAIFQSEQTTKTARWTFNNGAATTFNVQAEGAGDSNNDVILRGAWSDVFP